MKHFIKQSRIGQTEKARLANAARGLAKSYGERSRGCNVVQNMPEFQKAWGCKAGQPMVAENACHVW